VKAGAGSALEDVAVHGVTWLAIACGVGLLMAVLLLVPETGRALGPLTYGRWAPVHLNAALYGWCGLPLLGLLLRLYRGPAVADGLSRAAVQVWSGSLLAGAVVWLAGQTSGKPFLDWTGMGRVVLLGNLTFVSGVLLAGLVREWRAGAAPRTLATRGALWVGLLGVIVGMFVATDPHTYPAVNPASGGPTGASLLGSTLGVVAVLVILPWALGLHRPAQRRATAALGVLLAAHAGLFVALSYGGDHGHREPLQQAGLLSLLVWAWLVPAFLRRVEWPDHARLWLAAFFVWAALLLVTGLVAFLPDVLDRVKFTNALVAHAHVAMAGMGSGFAVVVLESLNRDTRLAGLFSSRAVFALWHSSLAVHVAALIAVGALEAADAGILFRPAPAVAVLYVVRTVAGAAMLTATLVWLQKAWRAVVP
jgi:cytochrome c oxidase cbb3-type subunit 1